MIEGVEILATGERLSEFIFSFPAALAAWFFCILMGMVFGSQEKSIGLGAIAGLLVGMIVGTAAGAIIGAAKVETFQTYKVTISDEVSMNEFMDKYEILSQEGKIYTVKEKTTDVD